MTVKTEEYKVEGQPSQNGKQDVKTRTIAICGTASSSRPEIMQQPKDVELWGINAGYNWMPRVDRLFDLHHHASSRPGKHLDWLKANAAVPIYMIDQYAHIPMSIRYPLEDVLQGGKYRRIFTSSIAYMLALAIYEGVSEIRLLGVDMACDSEYAYQRDACLYWIGIAEGLGITVYLPEISPLSQQFLYGVEPVGDVRRSALDWKDKVKAQMDKMNEEFVEKIEKELKEYRNNTYACTGALQLAEQMVRAGHNEPIVENHPKEVAGG